jgi:indolepyruvate ferredoxin oxidoreductase beta subunit
VQRGFVTPERTALIASSHRAYAVSEKIAMGDGIADGTQVLEAARTAARSFVHFDMQAIAERCDAVISAALFGALGGTGVLPFPRAAFEAVLGSRGAAADANRRAFALAWERAERGGSEPAIAPEPAATMPAGVALAERIRERLPAPAWATAWEACRQLADYQDARYAEEYLGILERVAAVDASAGGAARGHELTRLAARHLALWMSYQDAIRVASQKTRAARYAEIRREVRAAADELVYPVEFMHPRLEEICDVLPRALGAWIMGSPALAAWLRRFIAHGRRLQTYTLGGFLQLSVLAALRPIRRHTLRFAVERERCEHWLARVLAAAPHSYDLALQLVRCQRLLKGYGDTQARGWRSFACIMAFVADAPASDDTARTVARLREAALADEEGKALETTLAGLRDQRV